MPPDELPLEEELLLEELELLPEELFPLEEELVLLEEEVVPLDEEEEVVPLDEEEEVVPLEELFPPDDALPVLTPASPPLPPSPGPDGPPHEHTARVPRSPTPRRNDPRLRKKKGPCRMSKAEREVFMALLLAA
jgi:hypothetical protein